MFLSKRIPYLAQAFKCPSQIQLHITKCVCACVCVCACEDVCVCFCVCVFYVALELND